MSSDICADGRKMMTEVEIQEWKAGLEEKLEKAKRKEIKLRVRQRNDIDFIVAVLGKVLGEY